MRACFQCQLDSDLERHARLVTAGIEEIREGLGRELSVEERLDLVADEFELRELLQKIEERRFTLLRA